MHINPGRKEKHGHSGNPGSLVISVFILLILTPFNILADGKTIIFLTATDIETLDPGLSSDFYSGEVLNNIFEGLVKFQDEYKNVEPALAIKWKSYSNGKIWEFELRRGVKFHDGRTFNADDVLFTFAHRLKNPLKYKYWNLFYSSIIKQIEKLSDYKVRFILKKQYIPFLYQLTTTTALIIPRNSTFSFKRTPIGTGPFRFVKWDKGKYVTIEKNRSYWEKNIRIERVIFKIVRDPAWRILQIKNHKGDVTVVESDKELNEIKDRNDLKIISKSSFTVHYLGFNLTKSPLNNIKLRKAIAHLIDKKALVKHIFQKFAKNISTPVPPGIFGFNRGISDHSFDIKKAEKLLEESGIKGKIILELAYSRTSKNLENFANAYIRSARKINLVIKKMPMSFSDLRKKLHSNNFDIFMLGWQGNIPDPDVFLYPLLSKKRGNVNRTGYENPEIRDLIEMGRSELDPIKRKKIYFRIQEILKRDVPWIPLYNLNDIIVFNSAISNIRVNRFSYIYFKDCVWEDN